MATKIGTIQNPEKTEALLPRTCLKAIADKNGDYISEEVLASDINALKGGALSSLILRDWRGSSYDLNDAKETGIYIISTTTVNSPSGSANGIVQVSKGSDSQITQTWLSSAQNTILYRRYGGSWNNWTQILVQGDAIKPNVGSWAGTNNGAIEFGNYNLANSFAGCIRFLTKNGGHMVLGVVGTQLAVGKYDRNGNYVNAEILTSEFNDNPS